MNIKSLLLFICIITVFGISCKQENAANSKEVLSQNNDAVKIEIASMLDSFNIAAAQSNFNEYFNFFTEDATYLGTDAMEHWDKKAFMIWAKPFFDKKTTWDFKAIDRHIYIAKNGTFAWFDELLDAPFAKMCRGSGVIVKENGSWKIQQYVLSMTVPNEVSKEVTKIKFSIEDSLMNSIKSRKK